MDRAVGGRGPLENHAPHVHRGWAVHQLTGIDEPQPTGSPWCPCTNVQRHTRKGSIFRPNGGVALAPRQRATPLPSPGLSYSGSGPAGGPATAGEALLTCGASVFSAGGAVGDMWRRLAGLQEATKKEKERYCKGGSSGAGLALCSSWVATGGCVRGGRGGRATTHKSTGRCHNRYVNARSHGMAQCVPAFEEAVLLAPPMAAGRAKAAATAQACLHRHTQSTTKHPWHPCMQLLYAKI